MSEFDTATNRAPPPVSVARLGLLKGALFGARVLHWAGRRLNTAVKKIVTVEEARNITRCSYDRAAPYKRAQTQRLGLHGFEREAIAAFFPRAPSKVLVLGCGGGRELLALLKSGYSCCSSEPAPALAKAAAALLEGEPLLKNNTPVQIGGIEDCGQHAPQAPFDAVVVGWAAWGYVLREADRVDALRTLRDLCPSGPVLLSWQMLTRKPAADEGAKRGVPKGWTGSSEGGWRQHLRVSPGRGIAAALSAHQVADEGEKAGFSMVLDGTLSGGYPHAVLVPKTLSP